ncbi:hypothetical protein J3R30DRAFT_3749817 [Lentinula aciculospora]|uniref:Phosphatidate cytidylyltransferase n=1 Tax=Lentinula aciculospora TaxID=153920 RepID=A0A9W9DX14_9AGAR|nr:hypothetical protein J3R30DRAFT_3749817 [Lentinula aciculospora]
MTSPSRDRRRPARRTKSPSIISVAKLTTVARPPANQRFCAFSSPGAESTITKAKPLSPGSSDISHGLQLHDLMRKVIKTLEGLTGAHWDMEMFGLDTDEEEEKEIDNEKEKGELEGEGGDRSGKSSEKDEEREVVRELLSNGSAVVHTTASKKVDWEIPRKLLHSSIGFFTIYLYLSHGNAKIVVYTLWSALCVIAPADYLRLTYPSFARIYERHLGFLMRESERRATNGFIWYIVGVNFALTFYPLDIATVAILILSWADTAASTIGRLWAGHWGLYTPRLPSRLPIAPFLPVSLKHRLALPLAPRKSLAGFIAASLTGACIALGFWGWIAPIPLPNERGDVTWFWNGGVSGSGAFGGWLGLTAISFFAGLVSGVAEALGKANTISSFMSLTVLFSKDLGSLDDNLTLPIISGGCLWAFFKLLNAVAGGA